jgi:hypothetical protein
MLSVTLRAGAALLMGDEVVELPGIHDQISYHALALRLLDGHGYSFDVPWYPFTPADTPTAQWSFVYPAYLAGVYLLFGVHPLTARLIQAVITGLLTTYLIYRLGNRVFGRRVGLVAASISAIYTYFIYYGAALMTESFFTVAALLSMELAHQLVGAASTCTGVVLGVGRAAASGCTALCPDPVGVALVDRTAQAALVALRTPAGCHSVAHIPLDNAQLPGLRSLSSAQCQCGVCFLLLQQPGAGHSLVGGARSRACAS